MEKIFIASVQIAFKAENVSAACDAVSACLSENLMQKGAILDWEYIKNTDNHYTEPMETEFDPNAQFEEGDLFCYTVVNRPPVAVPLYAHLKTKF